MQINPSDAVTRRRVIGSIGAGAVATLAAGSATAEPEGHVVGFEPSGDVGTATEAADGVRRTLDFDDVGRAVAGRFSKRALERLRERPDVRYVEPDYTATALGQEVPFGVDRIDADVVHDFGETGAGIDVAVIDTGIDSDHPDLQANLGTGTAFVNCTGSGCNHAWDDDNDHGTHCAGTIAAVDNDVGVVGVAPEATLHAVKVLDDWGSGTYSDIAAGIQWTADQGYDVANLSIGGSASSQVLEDAVTYAHGNGVFLAGAAGGYPAEYSEVVAVTRTDCGDVPENLPSGTAVDLAAPGQDVLSTVVDGYATLSGGSMATAATSGAAALVMSRGFSNAGTETQLCATAENLGYPAGRQGCGLVDAAVALGYPSFDDGSC